MHSSQPVTCRTAPRALRAHWHSIQAKTSWPITVLVDGDDLGEPDETFSLGLSRSTKAVIADSE